MSCEKKSTGHRERPHGGVPVHDVVLDFDSCGIRITPHLHQKDTKFDMLGMNNIPKGLGFAVSKGVLFNC